MIKRIRDLIVLFLFVLSFNTVAQGPYNPSIVVTKTTDENPFLTQDVVDGINTNLADVALVTGTLQWAIRKAEKDMGADHIVFSGNLQIQIQNSLPRIYSEIFIDGTTFTGYLLHTNMVQIDGLNLSSNGTCFMLETYIPANRNSNNSKIEGIYIHSFGEGIRCKGNRNIVIKDNVINRILTFSAGGEAITIVDVGAHLEMISIKNNIIGTDVNGSPSLGNQTGIFLWAAGSGTVESVDIGGINVNERNIIRNNSGVGVGAFGAGAKFNRIRQNEIYDNGLFAIKLNGTNQNKPVPIITSVSLSGFVFGTAQAEDLIEIFGSTGTENANEYLTTATADASGNWTANLGVLTWPFITATATDFTGKNAPELENTSQLSIAHPIPIVCPTGEITISGNCMGEKIDFDFNTTDDVSNFTFAWDFGDGGSSSIPTPTYLYTTPGTYTVTLTVSGVASCTPFTTTLTVTIIDCIGCEDCIGSFAPLKEKKYVLSAWVKENTPTQVKTYTGPQIILEYPTIGQFTTPFTAKGKIIDGWQRVEEVFTIPATAFQITVKLNNVGANDVFYDDIRIHPFDANMKSFVYDPVTLRLVAELDENNYATFYEYDEEGKLIRVKKETERGIKTIQESRDNTVK